MRIYKMGIGVSKQKSTLDVFQTSLNETINQAFIEIAQQSLSSSSATQVININGLRADGNVTIKDLEQVVVANIDASQFVKNINETELRSILTNSIKVAEKQDQSIEQGLMGGYTNNANGTGVHDNNINRVANSYSYSQFMSMVNNVLTSQTVDISGINAGRNITIKDINQYIKIEVMTDQIVKTLSSTFVDIATENGIDVKKKSKQKSVSGLSSTAVVAIVTILIIAIVIGGGVYLYQSGMMG